LQSYGLGLKNMLLYLDNCCFNRPFDDQSQLRIYLETVAKLQIQTNIRSGLYRLVWSYILDYENSQNPFRERREQIAKWRVYSKKDIIENSSIIKAAKMVRQQGIKEMDSLHLACAIEVGVDYFLTTDDGVLNKAGLVTGVKITDPIGFIKEVSA